MVRHALVFGLALVGCGTSGTGEPPAPQPAEASTTAAAEPSPAPDLPAPEPEPVEPMAAPLAMAGQIVPQVPAVLPPPPEDAVLVFATTAEVRVGETTVPVGAGSLPTAQSLVPIGETLAETTGMVVVVVDAAVSAGLVRRLIDLLPRGRTRAVLARGADGTEGMLSLSTEASADAPEVTISTDGFRVAQKAGGPQLHLKVEGDPFDYTGLRNKAKAFRTTHPDIDTVRVGVAPEVSAEVLLRALSQLRGPKCTVEPERCWLPGLALGEGGPTSTPRDDAPQRPADGAPGTAKLGKATVPDALDADEVRKVLEGRVGYARMCYFAALADAPGLKGTMLLRLTVDANGEVEEVAVPSGTLKNADVQACLERGVKGLRFSPPTKAPVLVDVPLTFTPGAAAK